VHTISDLSVLVAVCLYVCVFDWLLYGISLCSGSVAKTRAALCFFDFMIRTMLYLLYLFDCVPLCK
jgi:hypothetical protein